MFRRSLLALLLAGACHSQAPAAKHLQWLNAPASGDVAEMVSAENAKANQDGKRFLVYVGAAWCEPCEHFHKAAEAGALDQDFALLRIYAFDFDRDAQRLAAAGYKSPLIPLFAVPDANGRATDKLIYGSVKGAGAVAEITPRLKSLLDLR